MTSIIKQAEISLSHRRSCLIQHAPPVPLDCISLPLAPPRGTCTLCICGRIRRTRGGASIPTLQGGRRSQKGAVSISGVGGTKAELWGSKLFWGFAISEPRVCLHLSLTSSVLPLFTTLEKGRETTPEPEAPPYLLQRRSNWPVVGRMRTSENDIILQIGAERGFGGGRSLGECRIWDRSGPIPD